MQTAFTVSSAMCSRSAEASGIEHDLTAKTVEANTMKAYVTELMQESSQTLTQLLGANGYKVESIASRGIIDSRPFMVFEGSNEMLYTQITEMLMKQMRRKKVTNLAEYLKDYELTQLTAAHFSKLLDFNIDDKIPQRKQVLLGKTVSRIVAADYVAALAHKGFRQDLTDSSIDMIRQEVATLLSAYQHSNQTIPVEDYRENSSWTDFS
jgi:uncharacterized membrane protein YheB (UPF0754 family)